MAQTFGDDQAHRLLAGFIDKLPADVREAVVDDVRRNEADDPDLRNFLDFGKAVNHGRQLRNR